jgi:hypothetical protein
MVSLSTTENYSALNNQGQFPDTADAALNYERSSGIDNPECPPTSFSVNGLLILFANGF